MSITGKDLIEWGYKPGAWFKDAVAAANAEPHNARQIVAAHAPPATIPLRHEPLPHSMNIRPESDDEADNVAAVDAHMRELMKLPTVKAGAVMPDACPSDKRLGYIPVGGVVATENAIHPGMHSADICCSMAVTLFQHGVDPKSILDAGSAITHFGGGGRKHGEQWTPPPEILADFENNTFLKPFVSDAIEHFGTQGDGNHFFYVGRVASSGQTALVTHHGSRKPGAMLYKAGMKAAQKVRLAICPEVPDFNAWLIADSREGQDYWAALQTVRYWTKANHFAIHRAVSQAAHANISDQFWNEHNFVFQRSDGLFYHAKGATPAFNGFASDSNGLTLIPLNMAEPILITRGLDAANGLGFAPHGAGRNYSRTAHIRSLDGEPEHETVARETAGIDARFHCGIPDVSELPSAYKSAASVRGQIAEFGLADVVDTIEPFGCIMAGDWQRNAPWRKPKAS